MALGPAAPWGSGGSKPTVPGMPSQDPVTAMSGGGPAGGGSWGTTWGVGLRVALSLGRTDGDAEAGRRNRGANGSGEEVAWLRQQTKETPQTSRATASRFLTCEDMVVRIRFEE